MHKATDEEPAFNSRSIRPQNRVTKLAEDMDSLKSGLEATNTKIDKLINLIPSADDNANQVILSNERRFLLYAALLMPPIEI